MSVCSGRGATVDSDRATVEDVSPRSGDDLDVSARRSRATTAANLNITADRPCTAGQTDSTSNSRFAVTSIE
jgi:hypothetical protein